MSCDDESFIICFGRSVVTSPASDEDKSDNHECPFCVCLQISSIRNQLKVISPR